MKLIIEKKVLLEKLNMVQGIAEDIGMGLHHGHKLVVASADQAPQDVLQVKHYCYTEKHEYDMDTSI